MAMQFKFGKQTDEVILDPDQGYFTTTRAEATVEYRFRAIPMMSGSVDLIIDHQEFEADDLEDLISFLRTAWERLVEHNDSKVN